MRAREKETPRLLGLPFFLQCLTKMKVCVIVLTLLSGSIVAQKNFDDIFRDILFDAENVKSVDEQQQQQQQQQPESMPLVQLEIDNNEVNENNNEVNDSMNGTTRMEGTDSMESNENIGFFRLENSNCFF